MQTHLNHDKCSVHTHMRPRVPPNRSDAARRLTCPLLAVKKLLLLLLLATSMTVPITITSTIAPPLVVAIFAVLPLLTRLDTCGGHVDHRWDGRVGGVVCGRGAVAVGLCGLRVCRGGGGEGVLAVGGEGVAQGVVGSGVRPRSQLTHVIIIEADPRVRLQQLSGRVSVSGIHCQHLPQCVLDGLDERRDGRQDLPVVHTRVPEQPLKPVGVT
mmetsp:Transcript_10869/g.26346  ORF Transcript_10869/g.26346 Transcript_10869/m.26346 type:complete len:213 (+) Transcript_10869:176-814(+)